MKTIALVNIKGGVGKTTSTLAIAQILHDEYHKRVLVVDLDHQANSTAALGARGARLTTADLLTSREQIAEQAIVKTPYGLDIIPTSFALLKSNMEVMLDATRRQQTRLRNQLSAISDQYDYCILDCAPNLDMGMVNALAAADDVLVPVRADQHSIDGFSYVIEAMEEIRDFNADLRLVGCFITMDQPHTNLAQYMANLLKEINLPTMKTTIRNSIKIGESSFIEGSIITYAPRCNPAKDYRKLVKEYLEEE